MRASSPRSPRAIRPTWCSSSGRAISCATRTRRRTGWCSTAPSACATPLPRKSAGRASAPFRVRDCMEETMPNNADDVVSGIIAKWSAGFGKLDADALAALYSKSAFFFGSNPTLYRSRDGVKAYFSALPRWRASRVQFSEVSTERVNADLVNMAAIASFFLDGDAPSLAVKITWVIAREDGDWKIVCHHVSSQTPLI